MSSLFSTPKIPKPEETKPPVDIDSQAAVKAAEADRVRRKRGRAATQVVDEEGPISTAARTLTGFS